MSTNTALGSPRSLELSSSFQGVAFQTKIEAELEEMLREGAGPRVPSTRRDRWRY